jgi:asparagine synthetase B (glutamine-hydrolysing)
VCGIAGVRRFGTTPITGEELVLLLCSIEHRGQHATGIALEDESGVYVYKAPKPAWKFTESQEFKEFLQQHLTPETRTALLHTRWYTVGSPEINENNHPMWDGSTAIVHNGCISNAAWLFTSNHYERSCETDSDIIRAIIAKHGMGEKAIRELSKMAGSAAIAAVSTKYPGKLMLARSGSPLMFGFTDDGDKMYWASEAQAILKACKPFKQVRGVWVQDTKINISIGSMPDNTAWVFGEQEIELHQKFDSCSYYRQPDYSKGRENYHAKMKAAKVEARVKKHQEKMEILPPVVAPIVDVRGITERMSATPNLLKGAVAKCSACGKGNLNVDGLAWNKLCCADCGSPMEA